LSFLGNFKHSKIRGGTFLFFMMNKVRLVPQRRVEERRGEERRGEERRGEERRGEERRGIERRGELFLSKQLELLSNYSDVMHHGLWSSSVWNFGVFSIDN
jgi:hypothetical protein